MQVKPCDNNGYNEEDYVFENSWMMFSTENPYEKDEREIALFDSKSEAEITVCNLIEQICGWITDEGRWSEYCEEGWQ